MKAKELKDLNADQLREKLEELSQNLFNFRFTSKVANLENTSQIRSTRRNIARIKTILNDKAKA
jgi:large subunit ribosomal protein L29